MQIDWFSVLGADRLIDSIQSILETTNALIPATLEKSIILSALLIVFVLGLGLVFRLFFGRNCAVNRGISGFLEVLFIYAATVTVYTLKPWNLTQYLAPLPFAIFRGDILIVSYSACSTIPLLCSQLLSLIILCFIVHLLNFVLPRGRSFVPWLLMRAVCVVLAVGVDLAANTFLPAVIAESAPVALITVLAVTLLVSLFNPLLCILFTAANPIVGLLYTFFFSNTIGKNLTRAVLSAGMVFALFYGMDYFECIVINITPGALLRYSPFALALLGVWYVFDYKL